MTYPSDREMRAWKELHETITKYNDQLLQRIDDGNIASARDSLAELRKHAGNPALDQSLEELLTTYTSFDQPPRPLPS